MLKNVLNVVLMVILTIGTVTFVAPASLEAAEKEFRGSPRKALRQLKKTGGILALMNVGDQVVSHRLKDMHLKGWINRSYVEDWVSLPVEVIFGLDNSPASNRIRKSGKKVYLWARPYADGDREKVDASGRKTTGTYPLGAKLPDYSQFCQSFTMVLAPSNNYQIRYKYNQKFKIRKQQNFSNGKSSVWKYTQIVGTPGQIRDVGFRRLSLSPPYDTICKIKETQHLW